MLNLSKFVQSDNYKSVCFFDDSNIVKKWNLNLYECKELLPTIRFFCIDWCVPYEFAISHIIDNGLVYNLFEYTTNPNNGFVKKIATNGVYCVLKKRTPMGVTEKKVYKDVYITESSNLSFVIQSLVVAVLEKYYPKFCVYDYIKKCSNVVIDTTKRMSDVIDELEPYNLSVSEFVDLVNGKSIYTTKLSYRIYDDIYQQLIYNLGYDTTQRNLYIPMDAIINNDWSIVENYEVNDVFNEDEFIGIQKDSPIWDMYKDEIGFIKKLFN